MEFTHLKFVKQGYYEHLIDAFGYSFTSLKASIYFLIHGLFPDFFEFNGSNEIQNLNTVLTNKKLKILNLNK
jgi:hypothetical protein